MPCQRPPLVVSEEIKMQSRASDVRLQYVAFAGWERSVSAVSVGKNQAQFDV